MPVDHVERSRELRCAFTEMRNSYRATPLLTITTNVSLLLISVSFNLTNSKDKLRQRDIKNRLTTRAYPISSHILRLHVANVRLEFDYVTCTSTNYKHSL